MRRSIFSLCWRRGEKRKSFSRRELPVNNLSNPFFLFFLFFSADSSVIYFLNFVVSAVKGFCCSKLTTFSRLGTIFMLSWYYVRVWRREISWNGRAFVYSALTSSALHDQNVVFGSVFIRRVCGLGEGLWWWNEELSNELIGYWML